MVTTLVPQEVTHPDTQAALLLCGTFVAGNGTDLKPLTLGEYNSLALWLKSEGRRPADLLETPEPSFPAGEPGFPEPERLRALLGRGVQMATALERWHRLGLWVIGRGEAQYPERLRRVLRSAAPVLLYGAGDVARLNFGGLAIVGSRHIDEEGLSFTQRVAEQCAHQDVQIISGGARGVDQAAVAAALEAGGGAVAVLSDRLDRAATSRDGKEALRCGRLTLVTPYEPESGFTVGRAMGRNKHIYALADQALVVRFTTGEGGTWAGADEQLRRNMAGATCVPVFVRVAHNPEDGWCRLRDQGALAFPEEKIWAGSILEVLSDAAALRPDSPEVAPASHATVDSPAEGTSTESPQELPKASATVAPSGEQNAPPAQPPLQVVEADTCYRSCLPLLLKVIRQEEPGERQLSGIAEKLDVLPKQLKAWLARAIREGKVEKTTKKRKRVYVPVSSNVDSALLDRGDDAA